jgi:hypothetical protein
MYGAKPKDQVTYRPLVPNFLLDKSLFSLGENLMMFQTQNVLLQSYHVMCDKDLKNTNPNLN